MSPLFFSPPSPIYQWDSKALISNRLSATLHFFHCYSSFPTIIISHLDSSNYLLNFDSYFYFCSPNAYPTYWSVIFVKHKLGYVNLLPLGENAISESRLCINPHETLAMPIPLPTSLSFLMFPLFNHTCFFFFQFKSRSNGSPPRAFTSAVLWPRGEG